MHVWFSYVIFRHLVSAVLLYNIYNPIAYNVTEKINGLETLRRVQLIVCVSLLGLTVFPNQPFLINNNYAIVQVAGEQAGALEARGQRGQLLPLPFTDGGSGGSFALGSQRLNSFTTLTHNIICKRCVK